MNMRFLISIYEALPDDKMFIVDDIKCAGARHVVVSLLKRGFIQKIDHVTKIYYWVKHERGLKRSCNRYIKNGRVSPELQTQITKYRNLQEKKVKK